MSIAQNNTEAIAAMSSVVASLEARIAQLNTEINEQKFKRAQFLQNEVARLLPDFSNQTFDKLRSRMRIFIDDVVIRAFSDNRKVLFLFKPSGYDAALSAIQTRLAHFIDQSREAPLPEIDAAITKLADQLADLDARHLSTLDIIRMLNRAQQKNIPLPQDLQAHLSTIAQRARVSGTSYQYTSSTTYSSNDDGDLWLYYFTDIPTSFRTMVADCLISHNDSAFVSSMNSSSYQSSAAWQAQNDAVVFDDANPSATANNIDFDDAKPSATGTDIDFDDGKAASQIATDDRLGAFS